VLLLLTGCSLLNPGPKPKEVCATQTAEAVSAWKDVADYFDRKAELKEPDVLVAEANAEEATSRRKNAQGSRNTWQKRKTTGLIDMKTGEERKDPNAVKDLEVLRQEAGARVEVRTDEEAELLATAMELRAEYDDVLADAARAHEVVDALRDQPLSDSWLVSREAATDLVSTELTLIARVATDEANDACAGVP
jgi:hypothetical protein